MAARRKRRGECCEEKAARRVLRTLAARMERRTLVASVGW